MPKYHLSLTDIDIDDQEVKAVTKVIRSGHLVQGREVAKLEKEFAALCGTKYALAVANGTAALHLALHSAGIKNGDEVITTPFTFVATANSILMVGGKPVFVDIDPLTYNLDPEKIISAITKKTKAILVVDLYGQPANYRKLRQIASKYSLLLIEDAAQSVNAKYYGKTTGSLADIATFSLYATKNITSAEGGVVTTNNRNYYEIGRLFRHHGQNENKKYHYEGLGYNYRLTDLQAAMALVQMKKLNRLTKKRQQLAAYYTQELRNIKGIVTPVLIPGAISVYHQYTIRITAKAKLSRDKLQAKLAKDGITTNIYYPVPLYRFSHLKQSGKLMNTENAAKEVLSIPVHPHLTDREAKYIISRIRHHAS